MSNGMNRDQAREWAQEVADYLNQSGQNLPDGLQNLDLVDKRKFVPPQVAKDHCLYTFTDEDGKTSIIAVHKNAGRKRVAQSPFSSLGRGGFLFQRKAARGYFRPPFNKRFAIFDVE